MKSLALLLLPLLALAADPLPPSPEKFGQDWAAGTHNSEMLKDETLVNEESKKANVSQEDSYVMASNVLVSCVEVAFSGRKDEQCQTNPNHPECVGVNGALKNGTTCREHFVPASLGCKVYGSNGYGLEEWIAIGTQFQNQMTRCANSKSTFEARKDAPKLQSLTDLLGSTIGGTSRPDLSQALLKPSAVSGQAKVSTLDWEELGNRIQDGASYLGYQNGDLIRATAKGESFAAIVTESPFAKGLNYLNRAKLDEGLADADMIAKRVQQSEQLGAGGEFREEEAILADAATANAAAESPVAASNAPAQPAAGTLEQIAKPKPAESRPLSEAARIEAVAQAATLSRKQKRPYRALASLGSGGEADLVDTTLFQRISLTYRRRTEALRPLDSRAGDAIRSLEQPEIFQKL